jgi:hypothetical protein
MQTFEFQKSAEIVRGGVATAHRLQGLPGKLSGCIYRSDLTKVHLSERFGGFMGDYVESDNPEVLPERPQARKLVGRGLYLGHYMGGHYGHFITETLSTFWAFEDHAAADFDYFLFHPFVFGERIAPFVAFCFRQFGIKPDKIVFVGSEPLSFDELLVPERLFRLNHSADPRLRWVYRQIAEGAHASAPGASRLYLSRRRFSRGNFERVVANEVDMEAEFRRRGFEVLYPEAMDFEDQVARYSRADCVAGLSGSGLHNSLFMRPHALLIELGDPRYSGNPAPSQALCNSISGVEAAFIPFNGPRFGRRATMLFNLSFLRSRLDTIPAAQVAPDQTSVARRSPWRYLLDMAEVAFLSVRPTIGSIARDVLRRPRVRR